MSNIKISKNLAAKIRSSLKEMILSGETNIDKLAEVAHTIWSGDNLKEGQNVSPDTIRLSHMRYEKLADYRKEDFKEIVRLSMLDDLLGSNKKPVISPSAPISKGEALNEEPPQGKVLSSPTATLTGSPKVVMEGDEGTKVIPAKKPLPIPSKIPHPTTGTFGRNKEKVKIYSSPEHFSQYNPGKKIPVDTSKGPISVYKDSSGTKHIIKKGPVSAVKIQEFIKNMALKDKGSLNKHDFYSLARNKDKNPYLVSNPMEDPGVKPSVTSSHRKNVDKIINKLNTAYGEDLQHDDQSRIDLANKIHAARTAIIKGGYTPDFKQKLKQAESRAIHEDYLDGVFKSRGIGRSDKVRIPLVTKDKKGVTTKNTLNLDAEQVKEILLDGTYKNKPISIPQRKMIKKYIEKAKPFEQEFKEGATNTWQDLIKTPHQFVQENKSLVNAIASPAKFLSSLISKGIIKNKEGLNKARAKIEEIMKYVNLTNKYDV